MKVLVHLGMGGHTSQILRLLDQLEEESKDRGEKKYSYEYFLGHDDQTSAKKIKYLGKIHVVQNPRLMRDKLLFIVFLKMIPTTVKVMRVLLKNKPDVIISTGPSLAIPLFWLGKLLGAKTIFVESWVRVHHRSQAGRFCYPVSDLFFMQWPTMKKVYPRAIYAGRLS